MTHTKLEGSIALLDDVVEHMAFLHQNGAPIGEWSIDAVQTVISRLEREFRMGNYVDDSPDEDNEED